MKKNQRNNRRRKAPKRKVLEEQVFRTRGRGVPWNIQQGTSGTGGLSSNQGLSSLSSAVTTKLNPFSVGGRLANFASIFDQYKVHSFKVSYVPMQSYSGQPDTPAGAVTATGLVERTFCLAFYADPATGAPNYASGLDSGGSLFRTCERGSIGMNNLQAANWLYTSTTMVTGSATVTDVRQTCFGMLSCNFTSTSSGVALGYGFLVADWDVSFRSPITLGAPIGTSISMPTYLPSKKDDEEKRNPIRYFTS